MCVGVSCLYMCLCVSSYMDVCVWVVLDVCVRVCVWVSMY
jgi:hypothetical protein